MKNSEIRQLRAETAKEFRLEREAYEQDIEELHQRLRDLKIAFEAKLEVIDWLNIQP